MSLLISQYLLRQKQSHIMCLHRLRYSAE